MRNTLSITAKQFAKQFDVNAERAIRGAVTSVLTEANTPLGAGGPMPVDTGLLRGSLSVQAGRGAMKQIRTIRSGDAWKGELNAWKMGKGLRFGWTAPYADHVEYGAQGRPGRGFARMAASRLPVVLMDVWSRLNRGK